MYFSRRPTRGRARYIAWLLAAISLASLIGAESQAQHPAADSGSPATVPPYTIVHQGGALQES